MSEKIFINKRQRARKKNAIPFTFRMIAALIALSLLVYMSFAQFVDDRTTTDCVGGCEEVFSLGTWVLSFAIIFGVVIAAGVMIGLLFALIRRMRGGGANASYIAGAMQKNTNNTTSSEEGNN